LHSIVVGSWKRADVVDVIFVCRMLNAPLPHSAKAQYKTMAPGQSIKRSLKHSLQQKEEAPFNPVNVRSQIICTVGPATNNVEILSELLKNGMSVARLNFSHGSYEYHASVIQNVRAASKATGHTCAIMLDTKGPEIRTGKYRDGRKEVTHAGSRLHNHLSSSALADSHRLDCANIPLMLFCTLIRSSLTWATPTRGSLRRASSVTTSSVPSRGSTSPRYHHPTPS
jgi:hypothetical protein